MKIAVVLLASILAAAQAFAAIPEESPPASRGAVSASVVYINRGYGFRLTLPSGWRGYSVLVDHREVTGNPISPKQTPSLPEQDYTVVTIRHPRWTKTHPREDLPIMVFTLAQWEAVTAEDGTLVISAAPFPPSELSRNGRYVFALPARYNYDYSTGWRELERILKARPLRGF